MAAATMSLINLLVPCSACSDVLSETLGDRPHHRHSNRNRHTKRKNVSGNGSGERMVTGQEGKRRGKHRGCQGCYLGLGEKESGTLVRESKSSS